MNIGDIAEMAGVSRAAVSRYLNNGYISGEKRERIRKVIEETGYQPSLMAQTLRTRKTRLIGVILPRVNSDSISSILEGISQSLSGTGYEMLLGATSNNPERELDFLRIFSNKRVDGVILVATVFTKEHLRLLKGMQIPVVIAGQRLGGFSCVYHDDFGAGCDIARYVTGRGRRRIGYIGVLEEDVAVGRMRREGVRKGLLEADTDFASLLTADFSVESGMSAMEAMLGERPDLDAVICATDRIAIGAMHYLKSAGCRIPSQIAVTGFGDNQMGGVTTPALTTVHFHYEECGRTAAEKIVEQLEGSGRAVAEIRLGYELMPKESA